MGVAAAGHTGLKDLITSQNIESDIGIDRFHFFNCLRFRFLKFRDHRFRLRFSIFEIIGFGYQKQAG